MAKTPSSVEIRAYQVGFGDCFLVTFVYDATDRRSVLIDFGTTELPAVGGNRLQPSKHMPLIANEIQKDCEGRLTAVVATHRHADHISGFATVTATGNSGEIIKQLKPKLVLQPWTEDPDAKTDATKATRDSSRSPKASRQRLQAMHDIARGRDHGASPTWMSAACADSRSSGRQHQEQVRGGEPARHGRGQGRASGVGASRLPSGLDSLPPA